MYCNVITALICASKHVYNTYVHMYMFTRGICSYMVFCFIWLLGKRQTVLFSATQTRNVDDLARISLKKTPMYVGVDDHRDTATVEGLEQVSQH